MTDSERNAIFESWVDRHGPLLHRTARAFADSADADDLRQELLLALWRAVPAFRSESRVSTFVYRVLHNAALSWRRGRRRGAVESLGEPELVPDHHATGGDVEDERLLDLLYEHIRELSPISRSLMLLSLDGLSYEEIGAVHGMSPNLVGVRLHRLRKTLFTNLQEKINGV